jgi:multiple sugar transport system substrate-binding protein
MKPVVKLLTLVVALLLVFSAVGARISAQDAVTISFWSRDSNRAAVEALVKEWNATHKNQIEATIIPASEFVTKFGTAVAGGAAPDLLAVDLIYVPAFAAAGQLTEITDFANAVPFLDKLSPSHVRLATYQEKIYALPFNAEGSVLLYNKALFKEAGLDPDKPPTTWDEIYESAKKITALGNENYGFYFAGACPGCNAFTFLPLIWASGGDVLSEDATTPTLTDPAVKAALEFYKKMWDEKLIPEGAKVDTGTDFFGAFATGKIGMTGSGAFATSLLKSDYPDIDFGVTFLPGQTGGKSSFAGGDSIGIPAGSKYPKEAFEFIQWMHSEEIQLEQFARLAQLPVRIDLSKNKYFDEDPRLTTNAEAMALGETPYSIVYNELFNDANGPWLAMIQTAIFEGKVDEAIAAAQVRFEQIMAPK